MIRLHPLNAKLLRDLLRLRAQGLAVAGLLAIGVGLMLAALGMRASLQQARDDYYRTQLLADLQVGLVRAPLALAERIAGWPGVQAVEARAVAAAILDLPAITEPISARLISFDDPERTPVNRPWLVAGRWPASAAGDQIVLNEAFAAAHGLGPGDSLAATIRGARETLRIVGIANSPEFVFVAAPGQMFPQPDRYAVIWMPRRQLEQAAELGGAFNDLALRLGPGVDPRPIRRELDLALAGYGAQPARGRERLASARFLDQELDQLATMARLLPPAFLAVAAFLLNVSLTRLVEAERSNIGLLKAFGFAPATIARHYLGLAGCLALLGIAGGGLIGAWLGQTMAELYLLVYRLPALPFSMRALDWLISAGVGALAALAGSLIAVRRVLALSPAAALAPPPPPAFRHGPTATRGLLAYFDPLTRVALRRILGFPRRSLTTVAGVVCALSLLILARQFPIAIEAMLELAFGQARRQQVSLLLVEADGPAALQALRRLPGVLRAEPFRGVAVVYRFAGREVDESLMGYGADAELERLVDIYGRPQPLRDDGLIVSAGLARQLGARLGDRIEIEVHDGPARVHELPVLGIVETAAGSSGYLELGALGRLLDEPGRIRGVHLQLDAARRAAFDAAVSELPRLAGVGDLALSRASMERTFNEGSGFFAGIFISFAVLMAIGIAYATASVTLGEQRRDLATLQVLGFSRAEASYVLIAEIGLLAALALPPGVLLGHWFAAAFLQAMATDLFVFPPIWAPQSYAVAVLIVLAAIGGALALVRRQIDRIDLVESLKSRE